MVETPEEAIAFFLECALDGLIIGEFVIEKPASGMAMMADVASKVSA